MLRRGLTFLGVGFAFVGGALWHMGPCATTPQLIALLMGVASLLAGLGYVLFGLAKLARPRPRSN
jgi:hypothetical protein